MQLGDRPLSGHLRKDRQILHALLSRHCNLRYNLQLLFVLSSLVLSPSFYLL